MRRHSVRPQPIQKPDLVDEKVDVDGCADAGEEGNDEEGQRAGVAEEAGEPEDVVVEESAAPPIARSPRTPSKKEVDDHNRTHLPFQNWCEACIKGRGIGRPPIGASRVN